MNNFIKIKTRYTFISVLMLICIFSFNSFGQEDAALEVSGVVLDASSNQPVAGANITIKSFSSVFTGEDGRFTINVPTLKATMLVKASNFSSKEVALRGKKTFEIKLHSSDFKSYYGEVAMPLETQSQTSITNAVGTIRGDIANGSKTVAQLMSGEVAGLRTLMRSGTPGVGANMFLRGYNSLFTTSQPLIIVDGMILETNAFSGSMIEGYQYDPLSDINPKEIANITVIKDASSLYGSKAANGVILIETTRTTDISTKVDFYVQGGLNAAPGNIPMMDASQYKNYLVNQISSSGMISSSEAGQLPFLNENTAYENYQQYHNNTDWQREVFENSYSQDYFFRVTGGDEIAKYGVSVGFMDDGGVIKNTDSKRFSTRFNSESTVTKRFSINTNLSVGYQTNSLSDDGLLERSSPLYTSLLKSPMLAPTTINGDGVLTNIYRDVDMIAGYSNPTVLTDVVDNTNTNYKLFGSFKLGYKFTDNLRLSSLIGANYVYNRDDVFFPSNGVSAGVNDYGDELIRSASTRVERFFSVYNDTRLSYNLKLDNHNIGLHLGGRYNDNNYENSYSESGNSGDDEFTSLQSGDKATFVTAGSIGKWKYSSVYSNVNYSFLRKYFLNVSMSYEGSSRFGENENGNTYGFFPSVGAGWLISSEEFMKDLDVIDQLKVRASYGATGNDQIGNYNSISYFVSQRFLEGTGLISGNLANSAMQWEKTIKSNIGLDLGLFNERLMFNIDLFSHVTDNLLNVAIVNPIYGYSGYLNNQGELTNKGYEIGINARIIDNSDFKWDVGGNISHYKNEITSLPGGSYTTDISGVDATILNQEGSAIGLFYGYETDGIYSTQDAADAAGLSWVDYQGYERPFEAGDVTFVDKDDNNIIDEGDMSIIGDPNADFVGMFNTTVSYKNLSLSAVFTFSQGNDVYNALRRQTESMSNLANQTAAVANRWQVENQETTIPRSYYGDPMGNARFSDRWIEDGSYLRLKTLSLSYSPDILKNVAKDVSFYLTANNLITFTNYLGYDPEVSMSGMSYYQGIDAGMTPQFTSVFLGVKIGL